MHSVGTLARTAPPLIRSALLSLGAASVALAGAAAFAGRSFGLGGLYAPKALAVFGIGAVALLAHLPRNHPFPHFGAANRVTLARGLLVVLLAGLLGEPAAPSIAWIAAGAGTAALVMDGVDGRVARRTGEASAFGARFDMETDAVLMLVLAALVWQFGKAGPWVLLAGALRYAFVAAATVLPWLRHPMPPRAWRKTACVVQLVALIVALSPGVSPPWSGALAGAALVGLCASFAADVRWLFLRRSSHAH